MWKKLVHPLVLNGLLAVGKYLFNELAQEYTDISVCKCAVIMYQHLYITKKKKKTLGKNSVNTEHAS